MPEAAAASPASTWGFETRQIHAGQEADPTTGARAVPIYQTTAYAFRDTAHAEALFNLSEMGNIYTRIMNPTTAVFEERVAALEGGVGALATASGQAAITLALQNIATTGDHIVAGTSLYGGTYNLLHYTLPRSGVTTTFVDVDDLEAIRAAIRGSTKALYVESLGNPKGDVADIAALAEVAHEAGIPLIVDNTVPSPYLCQPLCHGADIVVHSATKYIGGHGTSMGGVIVDGGRFEWAASGRFPDFTEPDPSYHGLEYADALGSLAFILKARLTLLRDTGASIAPQNAWNLIQGLETLSLRMERHSTSAQAIAEWLEAREDVAWVNYPGLPSSKWHHRVATYLPKGCSSLITFGIEGGVEAGRNFIESLRLFSHVANIGDVRSLAIHPATTTHSQLSSKEREDTGTPDELVRLSIGLETLDDIKADLEHGFATAALCD